MRHSPQGLRLPRAQLPWPTGPGNGSLGESATGLSSVQVCFVTWGEGTLSPHLYRLKGYFPHTRTRSGALNSVRDPEGWSTVAGHRCATGSGCIPFPPSFLPPRTVSSFMPHRAWLGCNLPMLLDMETKAKRARTQGRGLLVWSLGCQGGDWMQPGARAPESQESGTDWPFSSLAPPMALAPYWSWLIGTLWTFSFLVYLSSSYQQQNHRDEKRYRCQRKQTKGHYLRVQRGLV